MRNKRFMYGKVILATSMIWFMFDVLLLLYYTDDGNRGSITQEHTQSRRVDLKGPGEMGQPVIIPPEEEELKKEMFKINQFNLLASNKISVNRTLPDVRIDGCKKKIYPPSQKLPTTSIIIVFHNEAWSTLIRNIHSIINRSPREILEEIILVDDASERDFLGKQLDDYVRGLSVRVRVVRMAERSGIVGARLRGAAISTGEVLTFLDAHCECTKGWLEPLIARIAEDRTRVVSPVIDSISDETFEYNSVPELGCGGFNWRLNFRWYPMSKREKKRRKGDATIPINTPTMAGGLFSIHKEYFYRIGTYDEGMDIWGGENIEMSFRIWMCGGTLEIVPCSHVGHVFRGKSPYTFPGGVATVVHNNNRRLAEVWMDEYKSFYYKTVPNARNAEYGDIEDRKQLREKLQCNSFRWYLENIFPDSQFLLDNYFRFCEVRNMETKQCLDNMGHQIYAWSKLNELKHDDLCLDASAPSGFKDVEQSRCNSHGGTQEWRYNEELKSIMHVVSGLCLDKADADSTTPTLHQCDNRLSQKWELVEISMFDINDE